MPTPSLPVARPERRVPYAFAWDTARPVVRKRRARKPTLAAAIKQANKAGVKVAGAVLDPSGTIELRFGEASADDSAASELDKWRSRRAGKSQEH